jgi:hypothetical protein
MGNKDPSRDTRKRTYSCSDLCFACDWRRGAFSAGRAASLPFGSAIAPAANLTVVGFAQPLFWC